MFLYLQFFQTSPSKKLPAFYVLDSIIKNVGTPYTLFFGRQLYSTFMEAYALVDNNVRSKMVEMLKTWKEPVPGSMDTRPVFPPEVTRPIENALIKARTSFLQAHQEQTRNQQSAMGRGRPIPSSTPFRETPTPPNNYRPPPQTAPGYVSNYPTQQYPAPIPVQQYAPQQAPAPQQYLNQQVPPNGQQYPSQQNGYQSHGLPPVSEVRSHVVVVYVLIDISALPVNNISNSYQIRRIGSNNNTKISLNHPINLRHRLLATLPLRIA